MSMLLMAKAMSIKVGNPLRKLVLVKLADNANDQGMSFPSYQYIADVCEISRRSAINHIEDLIEMGLVSKKERKNKDGSSSNLYFLHLDKGSEIPALPSAADSLGGARAALPPSAGDAPITSHSLEPVNESEKNKQKKSQSAVELLAEFGITDDLANDFITHRRALKAPITKTALVGFQREADKAKIPIQQAITISIERGWRGFKADWDWQDKTANSEKKQKFSDDDPSWWKGKSIEIYGDNL